jgi:hypothetical protein
VPASSATVTLRIGPPVVSTALAASTTGALQWYFKNRWHRLTYYRISAGVAPGQPGCGGGYPDPCLTVNGVAPTPASARMALVLAGRALPTQSVTRITLTPPVPPDEPYLRNFFEDANVEAPTADGIFARQPRSNAFNDRVVWVAP